MTHIATVDVSSAPESAQPAVSWGAIFAGSAVAAAVSLTLMVLGSGLGLAFTPPWSTAGEAAATFAVSAAIWFVIVQWVASAFGGYVAGRLRTRWVGVHTDEVFFRDTAHGFITWCVSTLVVATLLGSALSGIASVGAQATATVASGVARAAGDSTAYFADTLFRPAGDQLPTATPAGEPANDRQQAIAEAGRILATGIANGEFSEADRTYLAQMIAGRTGIAPADAQQRVNDVIASIEAAKTQAAEAAEAARKVGFTTTLLGFLALVVGAFIAAVSAALAGKLRDEDVPSTT